MPPGRLVRIKLGWEPWQGSSWSRSAEGAAGRVPLLLLQALLLCLPALFGAQVHAAGPPPPPQPVARPTGVPPQRAAPPLRAPPPLQKSPPPSPPPSDSDPPSEVGAGSPAAAELSPPPAPSPSARLLQSPPAARRLPPTPPTFPPGASATTVPSAAPKPPADEHLPPLPSPSAEVSTLSSQPTPYENNISRPPVPQPPKQRTPPPSPSSTNPDPLTQTGPPPVEDESPRTASPEPPSPPSLPNDQHWSPPLAPDPPYAPLLPPDAPPNPPRPPRPLPSTRGDLRLVDGPTEYEGRLEIFNGKAFGTVCDDRFTDAAAAVACRQLGWSPEGAAALCCGAYGSGGGHILLDEVTCIGAEARLEHCGNSGWGRHDCRADEAVAVRCNGTELQAPSPPPATPDTGLGGRNMSDPPPVRGMMSGSGDVTGNLSRKILLGRNIRDGTRNVQYRVVYLYSDGAHSCPSQITVPANKDYRYDVDVNVELSRPYQLLLNNSVGGALQREIVLQRKGFAGDEGSADWLNSTWIDILYMTTWDAIFCSRGYPSNRVLICADRAVDLAADIPERTGPNVVGWRWKHGFAGFTDGYTAASEFPELEAGKGIEGINATYQLVYRFDVDMFSYPSTLRLHVVHPSASTPITMYVQLASANHPTVMKELHLQRVEDNHVWTVDVLTLKSPQLRTGLKTLTFTDRTTRSLWGCPAQGPAASSTSYNPPPFPPPLPSQPPGPSGTDLIASIRTAAELACVLPGVTMQPYPDLTQQGQSRTQPAYRCQLVLRGWEQQPNGYPLAAGTDIPAESPPATDQRIGSPLSHASLHCRASSSGGILLDNTADTPGVQVQLGGQLEAALLARNGSMSGVHFVTSDRSVEDWGVTFIDVEHLTLVDSVVTGLHMSPYDALIRCWNCGIVNMENVTISGLNVTADVNYSEYSAGFVHGAVWVHVREGAALSNVTCTDVHTTYLWTCVRVTFEASAFSFDPPSLAMRGCKFLRNTVADAYGAVLIDRAGVESQHRFDLLVEDTEMHGNHGSQGAAITSLTALGNVVMSRSVLSNNTAVENGGAASFTQGVSRLIITRGSTMYGNKAGGSGGAVWITGAASIETVALMDGSTAHRNTAGMNGGAFAISPAVQTFMVAGGSSLSFNTASRKGGGVFIAVNVRAFCISGGSRADNNDASGSVLYIGILTDNTEMNGALEESDDIYVASLIPAHIVISANSSASYNRGGAFYGAQLDTFIVTDYSSVMGNNDESWGVVNVPFHSKIKTLARFAILDHSAAKYNQGGLLRAPRRQIGDFVIANSSHCDYNVASVVGTSVMDAAGIANIVVRGESSISYNGGSIPYNSYWTIRVQGSIGEFLLEDGAGISHNRIELLEEKGDLCGGAILANRIDHVTIRDGATVVNNTCVDGQGGFLAAMTLGSLLITSGAQVSNNKASAGCGGAIAVRSNLERVRIADGGLVISNTAQKGGALCVFGSVLGDIVVATGAVIEGNKALTASGGFLYTGGSLMGSVLVSNNGRISSNTASLSGGAIFAEDSFFGGVNVTTGGIIDGNLAHSGSGGAIAAKVSIATVHVTTVGSSISGNRAGASGGAFWTGGQLSELLVTGGGQIVGNEAETNGGAVSADLIGTVELSANAKVLENLAGGDGGAVSATRIGHIFMEGAILKDNTAGGSGGLISMESVPIRLNITGCNFTRNIAARGSGGVLHVHIPGPGTTLLTEVLGLPRGLYYAVQRSNFWENGAEANGGGISVFSTGSEDPTGKDSNLPRVPLTLLLSDCRFKGNYASAGGALSVVSPSIGAILFSLHVEGCDFWGNTAASTFFRSSPITGITGYGGALLVSSPPKFLDASDTVKEVVRNPWLPSSDADWAKASERRGSSSDGYGPDMHCQIRLDDSTFNRNVCPQSGGAIATVSCAVEAYGCSFDENLAGRNGGALAFLLDSLGATVSEGDSSDAQSDLEFNRMGQRTGVRRFLGDANPGMNPAGGYLTPSSCEDSQDQLNCRQLHSAASIPAEDYWSRGWWLLVWNSTFSRNSARGGGGALHAETVLGAGVQVQASGFQSNVAATSNGGAAYIVPHGDGARTLIHGSRFSLNTAYGGEGGAIYADMTGGASHVVRVESCDIFSNNATLGGALGVVAAPGSRLELVAVNAANNTAEQNGGAVTVLCVMGAATNSEATMYPEDATSTGSTQYTSDTGGATQPGAGQTCSSAPTVIVKRCNFTANQAWDGNGGALYLSPGTSVTSTHTLFLTNVASTSGGSIAGELCGQLLVAESNITRSSAGQFGGGLFALSCDLVILEHVRIDGCQAQTGGGACLAGPGGDGSITEPAVGLGTPNPSPLPVAVFHNVIMKQNQANVASGYFSEYMRYSGHGGALFGHGNVSIFLVGSQMGNNTALVGDAVATTQKCSPDPVKQSAIAIDKVFEALSNMGLAFFNTSGLSDEDNATDPLPALKVLTARRTCWPVIFSNFHMDGHEGVPLWSQDGAASALFVRCAAGAADDAASVVCPAQVQAASHTCQLAAHLAACGMLSQPAGTPQYTNGSVYNALTSLGSPPTHMRLMDPMVRTPGVPLQLRPGTAFSSSVVMYSSLGQPVQAAILPYKVAVSLEPATPEWDNGASDNITEAKRPWRDMSIGSLDPGFSEGRSLTVDLLGNTASWPALVARGWPGRYVLTFRASSNVDGNLYKIPPLRVDVELLTCRTGETLELALAQSAGKPWSGCTECIRNTYGLWRDSRMPLWSINTSSYLTDMTATLNAAANGPAACVACPEAGQAACPGGPVLVPEPGYWHSAPDSPRVHRCPLAEACGVGSDQYWAELSQVPSGAVKARTRSVLAGRHARYDWPRRLQELTISGSGNDDRGSHIESSRSQWLIRCQQDGYNRLYSLAESGTEANGSTNTSQAGIIGCQLWDTPTSSPTSYMQQQCARGFSGNLCATCEPQYFLTSEFECQTCPGLGKTIILGIIFFIVNLVIVLYTSLTNIRENYSTEDEDDVSASDILKVLIVHVQYFIIVGRLPVNYPNSITKCLSAAGALTGATNVAAYSPSCLFPKQHSPGQARSQMLGALVTPCIVTVVALLTWIIRYHFLNSAKFRRTKAIGPKAAFAARQAAAMQPAAADHNADNDEMGKASTIVIENDPSIRIGAGPADLRCMTLTGMPPATDSFRYPGIFASAPATDANPTYSGPEPFRLASGAASAGPPLVGMTVGYPSATSAADLPPPTPSALPPRPSKQPMALVLSQLRTAVSSALSGSLAGSNSALRRLDQAMSLQKQLGIVFMVAIFILYPSWAQASLSIFACYKIDDGTGPFPDRQKATWRYGYWVRDMNQECYKGVHLWFYVPLGVVFVTVFCLAPPIVSFVLLWWNRQRLSDPEFKQWYGFLYRRYRRKYFYWESVLQFQALGLVAVEVFGRAMAVTHQMLTMLMVFSAISIINIACRSLHTSFLVLLEFFSLSVLSMTITLSLFFTVQDNLGAVERNFIGILILILNSGMVMFFICGLVKVRGRAVWERISSLRQSWRSRSSGTGGSARRTSLERDATQSPDVHVR